MSDVGKPRLFSGAFWQRDKGGWERAGGENNPTAGNVRERKEGEHQERHSSGNYLHGVCALQGGEGMSKGDTQISQISQKLNPGGAQTAQSWVWVGTAALENLQSCLKGVSSKAMRLFALIIMVRKASALIWVFVINKTMYGLKGWWLPSAFLGVRKCEETLKKIPEWCLKWILVKLILRIKSKVHRSKSSRGELCQDRWATGGVALGTEGCLFSGLNFLKFICWRMRVGSRAALVAFIVKHVNKWISLINVNRRTWAGSSLSWKQTWSFGLLNCLWCQ